LNNKQDGKTPLTQEEIRNIFEIEKIMDRKC